VSRAKCIRHDRSCIIAKRSFTAMKMTAVAGDLRDGLNRCCRKRLIRGRQARLSPGLPCIAQMSAGISPPQMPEHRKPGLFVVTPSIVDLDLFGRRSSGFFGFAWSDLRSQRPCFVASGLRWLSIECVHSGRRSDRSTVHPSLRRRERVQRATWFLPLASATASGRGQ
jgi:hypothetical protein